METILLISLITWGLARYAGTELIATARGTEPPRLRDRQRRAERTHERRMAREQRRTGPTVGEAIAQRIADRIANPRDKGEPGPARRAMGEWWNDAWGYATDRRHRRHERHARGDLLRQRLARKLRDQFGTGGTPRPGDTNSPWRPRPTQRHQSTDRPGPKQPFVVDAEPADDQLDTDPPTTPTTDEAPDRDQPDTTDQEEPEQDEDDTDNPPESETDLSEPDTSEQTSNPVADDQPSATVHPIRKDTPMTSADPNLTSGETLDPTAAKAFCEGMKNLGERMHTQIEQSVSSLRTCGVSGEPIQLLEQMQENATQFISSAQAAMAHFDRHLNTQDQVLSDDTLAGTVNGTYIGTRS